jgi:TolB protein
MRAIATAAGLFWTAAVAGDAMQFAPAADLGGCAISRVTDAAPGELHFQFEGISHDDRRLFVAWEKGESRGAYILDLESGRRRDVPGVDNAGVFAPDDARILAAHSGADRTTELFEVELATGERRPVAPHPRHEFLATYSPDGNWILFNSYRTGRSDVYVVPRTGGEPERLTDFEGYEAHAAFSPDMKSILFHRNVGEGDYDIFRIDFASREITPFIAGPGEQSYPSWSPDGRFVAFASDWGETAGRTDIYVADAAGKIVSRITRSPGYNAYPSWSRDGRWLYFVSERPAGTRNVVRAAIDGAGGCLPSR